eukprot:TRINITY_DN2806_c0_g1_i19.p1 TRINITY_DN2806_c0_g1~~TRINITY_DN2806_c0_g1_i19.p1  ORF type:complete len:197 (-),score=39.13 TRINITY_DN2806_c0_g1_i19:151-696(-)
MAVDSLPFSADKSAKIWDAESLTELTTFNLGKQWYQRRVRERVVNKTKPPSYGTCLPQPTWSVTESYLSPRNKTIKPISMEEMKKVARLSMLSTDRHQELANILLYVEKIHELDTSNVRPLFSVLDDFVEEGQKNPCAMPPMGREDVPKEHLPHKAMLQNASVKYSLYFVVPKVKEEDVTN